MLLDERVESIRTILKVEPIGNSGMSRNLLFVHKYTDNRTLAFKSIGLITHNPSLVPIIVSYFNCTERMQAIHVSLMPEANHRIVA